MSLCRPLHSQSVAVETPEGHLDMALRSLWRQPKRIFLLTICQVFFNKVPNRIVGKDSFRLGSILYRLGESQCGSGKPVFAAAFPGLYV